MKNLLGLSFVLFLACLIISCSESTSSNDDVSFSNEAANGYFEYYNWYRAVRSMSDVEMNSDIVSQSKYHCSSLSLSNLDNHDDYDKRVEAIKKVFPNAKNITEITGTIVISADNYILSNPDFYPNTNYNESLYDYIGIAAKKSGEKDTWIATVIVIDSD
ncbi:hypothetical protein ACFLSQ_06665 [Bacteroidota bacterium]